MSISKIKLREADQKKIQIVEKDQRVGASGLKKITTIARIREKTVKNQAYIEK